MTTISSNASFIVEAAEAVVTESVSIHVLPLTASPTGKGRLYHPTLGTLDYPHSPDAWKNVDTDVIAPPPWAYTQTLGGAANTIWPSSIQDADIMESWTSEAACKITFLRQLLNFRLNPPAPEVDGYIEWYPSYCNGYGYKVVIYQLTAGGEEISLDYVTRQGWVRGPVVLRMRVIDRV